jgi:hypothetical protein
MPSFSPYATTNQSTGLSGNRLLYDSLQKLGSLIYKPIQSPDLTKYEESVPYENINETLPIINTNVNASTNVNTSTNTDLSTNTNSNQNSNTGGGNADISDKTHLLLPLISLGRYAYNARNINKFTDEMVAALNAGRYDLLPVQLNAPGMYDPYDRQLSQIRMERMAGMKPVTSDLIANNAL